MIAHYEDTKRNTFFCQLINLKQKGSMMEHIEDFQKLNIRVKYISKEHRIDVFIGTLKDNIQHEVHLWEPNSMEKALSIQASASYGFFCWVPIILVITPLLL